MKTTVRFNPLAYLLLVLTVGYVMWLFRPTCAGCMKESNPLIWVKIAPCPVPADGSCPYNTGRETAIETCGVGIVLDEGRLSDGPILSFIGCSMQVGWVCTCCGCLLDAHGQEIEHISENFYVHGPNGTIPVREFRQCAHEEIIFE